MTTLITAHDSAGNVLTCDARCYNAKGTECHCICGGLNHGKGENIATTFTDHLYELITMQIKIRFKNTKLVTFPQPKLQMTFHAPERKINAHESPSQNEGPGRNAPDR